jgi:hypothetical protein
MHSDWTEHPSRVVVSSVLIYRRLRVLGKSLLSRGEREEGGGKRSEGLHHLTIYY